MALVDVDDRGRVVLPKELREELGIRPGGQVRVDRGEGVILVRPARPTREYLMRLKAAFAALPKHPKVGEQLDPTRLKDIWTRDLPARYRR